MPGFVEGKTFKVNCSTDAQKNRTFIGKQTSHCFSGIPTREHCFISKQINMKYYWYSNTRTSQPRP